jgi:hypothetical protein
MRAVRNKESVNQEKEVECCAGFEVDSCDQMAWFRSRDAATSDSWDDTLNTALRVGWISRKQEGPDPAHSR